MNFSKEDMKDMMWRLQCKLTSAGKSKTLSDYSSGSSSLDDLKAKPSTAKTALSGSKDPEFGGHASVKTLYEGKKSGDNYIDWQDYPPRQVSKTEAKVHDRPAIKVYKVKDHDKPVISGKFALKFHRIDVQNSALVAALEPILKEKEDVHLDINETAIFNAPFRSLYFCYGDIVAKYRNLADDDALKPFLLLFIRVLDDIFHEVRAKSKQLAEKGLVSFQCAWTYFKRDKIVFSHGNNCDVVSKITTTSYVKTPISSILQVRGKVLRFNGEAFSWEDTHLEIPEFQGNRPVTELRHYPLEFHNDPEDAKAKLQTRGNKVLDYQGLTYALYSGVAISDEGKTLVDGRVLIDVQGYNKHHLAQGSREGKTPSAQKGLVQGTGRTNLVVGDNKSSQKTLLGKRLSEEEQQKNREAMLKKPNDLMFMFPLIEGYALKNKEWLSFFIEDLSPMEWNDEAFDHLVYDVQQKDLVLSFVESHGQSKPRLEDVIIGKGNGLIILLSGPPGTGKTLTAEAVADRTHRPLFYLQAEDLGINAAALGANVKKVFQMATEWDAVILLDEADVFMAERHPQDIARNELVSIFLRELEYFQGIIFLTTNMYESIDSAFRSRVSLHLLFPQLSKDARITVWRKFLDRIPKSEEKKAIEAPKTVGTPDGIEEEKKELDDEDVKELSEWNLNGREIKTAVKMAKSWCDHKGYHMDLARLESGIKVTSPHAAKATNHNDTDLYD